jgi:hypothetical protein
VSEQETKGAQAQGQETESAAAQGAADVPGQEGDGASAQGAQGPQPLFKPGTPPSARPTQEVKTEIARRAWIGLALVCVLGLLIGAILSIQGHDREWMARRLEAAEEGVTGERLVQGVLVPQVAGQGLRAPYSGERVLGYRVWRDIDRGERQEPFKNGEMQAWVPLAVKADGKTYPLDTKGLKATQLGDAWALVPARYEVFAGEPSSEVTRPAPTQQPPAQSIIEREVALKEGDIVSVLGVETGGALGGEFLVLFRGDVATWRAQANAPGESSKPVKLAGLGVMTASGLGLAWLVARALMSRRRKVRAAAAAA